MSNSGWRGGWRILLVLIGCLGGGSRLNGQTVPTAGTTTVLVWTTQVDVGGLAVAQGYTYTVTFDAGLPGADTVTLVATCADRVPSTAILFDCSAPFPKVNPGRHTVTLTATDALGQASPPSDVITFDFRPFPVKPINFRIGQKP
jgi:hypothetical protein